jgi:uncharacterized membrane protein YqjE
MFNGLRNLKHISAVVVERIELYSKLVTVEAKIEMAVIARCIKWGAIGFIFAFFALAMLHVAILSLFWYSDYRFLSIILLLLVDGLIAAGSISIASKSISQDMFAITKQQLAEDAKFVKDSI